MYLFLLGRDPELSKFELVTYFKKKFINYKIVDHNSNFVLVDFKNKKISPKLIMEDLGGITRIVKMYYTSSNIDNTFIDKLEFDYPKKFNFTISSMNLSTNKLHNIEVLFKEYYKSYKVKAVYKKPKKHSKDQKNYIANPINFYSWNLEKGFELFVFFLKNKFYFGKTVACFNPKINIFKDKHRPLKKELYSTSFRLSKIMINLLGLEKEKTILDPFCGTGNFLIEGLSLGYNVIGIDKDKEMVNISKKNVEWIVKELNLNNKCKIINADSTKVNFKADGVVFEPYMGPFLNKLPNSFKAKKIIGKLTNLYSDLFKNLKDNLKAKTKVAFVLPSFETYSKQIFRIPKNVFSKNGFSLVNVKDIDKNINLKNPISYSTPKGSKLQRTIFILEKN